MLSDALLGEILATLKRGRIAAIYFNVGATYELEPSTLLTRDEQVRADRMLTPQGRCAFVVSRAIGARFWVRGSRCRQTP